MKDCFIRIKDGEVDNRAQLVKFIEEMKKEEGVHYIKREKKNKRTSPQNRYLHGVMLPIVRDALRDAGWNHIRTLEDAKDFLKVKFLINEVVNENTGEIMTSFGRTSELNKEQFSILVEDVTVWLWEFFNITMPAPGQQGEMFKAA
jgi:hypothetical protein